MPSRDSASHSQQAPPAGKIHDSVSNHSVSNHSPSRNSVSSKKDLHENKYSDPILQNDTAPPPKPLERKDVLNYGFRWQDDGRFTSAEVQVGCIGYTMAYGSPASLDATMINNDLQLASTIGGGAGLLIGLTGHALCVKYNWYTKGGRNPFYRTFKTWAAAGWAAGTIAASFTPCSAATKPFLAPLFASGACLAFGAMAPAYMLYRRWRKIDPATHEYDCETGGEGYSKYGKTALVVGTNLGPAAAALYDQQMGHDLTKNDLNTATAIAGFGAFALGMVLVPAINRLGRALGYDGNILGIKKEFDADGNLIRKEGFRNNYVRTGMQLGAPLLTMILLLASVATPFSILIYGGLASVGLGVLFGAIGHKISPFLAKHWNLGEDPENGWDYSTRGVSMTFSSVGVIVGLCFGNPLLGAAIGGVFGWFAGLFAVWLPRKFISEEDNKTTSLPWTQRTGSGGIIGILVGTGVGLALVLCSGPLAPIALLLFPAIGSLIGNVVGGLLGKQTRHTMKLMFSGNKQPNVIPSAPSSTSTASTISSLRRRHSLSRSRSRSVSEDEDDVNPLERPAPTIDSPSPKDNEEKDRVAALQKIPANDNIPAAPGLLPKFSVVGTQQQQTRPQPPVLAVVVAPAPQQLIRA